MTPHPLVTTPPTPAPTRRRSCLLGCLVLLVGGACVLLLLLGGGYYLARSGQFTPMQIQAELQGAGEINVINAADEELTISLTQLDVPAESSGYDETLRLAPFDIDGRGALPAGRYQLDFSTPNSQPPAITCTIRLERGDRYQFVAVPEGIAVTSEGSAQTSADDVDAATAQLCQQ